MKISYCIAGLVAMVVMSLVSCSNPKEKIVERQKFLKKQIDSIELKIQAEILGSTEITKEQDAENKRILSLPKAEREAYFEQQVKQEKEKIMPLIILKEEYDSLEVELKKY